MKLVLVMVMVPFVLQAAQRQTLRCENCKQKEQLPAQMAQMFFNVVINGFIATQAQQNKEQQNAAVVNALQSVSNFVQQALKKNARAHELDIDRIIQELNKLSDDPEFIALVHEQLLLKRHQLAAVMGGV